MHAIVRIVVLYIVFSALWIYFSDMLTSVLQARYGLPEIVNTYKGWGFVLISGGLLFVILYQELKRSEESYQSHLQEKEDLLEQLRVKNQELQEAYDKTIQGWSRVLELRSREVKDHSRRVTELAVRLARELGLDENDVAHIRRGALLHDIGKMAIPDVIMLKSGELSDEDRATIRRHPLYGFEMLSEIEYLRPAIDVLLCHHEKWNGDGYPFGLSGDQIPLYARIFAVVDVWDALVSERIYREAQPMEVASDYLRAEAGEHFDPKIVDVFLEMIEKDDGLVKPEERS